MRFFFPTAHWSSVLDTLYSAAFQRYPFFPTLWAAMRLTSGVSFVLQDEEGEVWKHALCYHTPMHTSPTHVQEQGRPQWLCSPLPIPLAFIPQLQPGWTIAFFPPCDPCWSSTSGNNRVSGMSIQWCLMHGIWWAPWMHTWGASRSLEMWVTPPGSAFLRLFWDMRLDSAPLPVYVYVCGDAAHPMSWESSNAAENPSPYTLQRGWE